jgi:hypothetical protein
MAASKELVDAIEIVKSFYHKTDGYRWEPIEKPHRLSEDDVTRLELLHYHLDTALWRLRLGDIEKKLKSREIDYRKYTELMDELNSRKTPYNYI